MDIIINYLESMFSQMPDTAETRRARNEIASMMEDKYAELKAEGKSENEAIGTVIAEFGNMEELMRELEPEKAAHAAAPDVVPVSDGIPFDEERRGKVVTMAEARGYLEDMGRWSRGIASGVYLCILSPGVPVLLDEFRPDGMVDVLGAVVFFLFIAVAVYLFIVNGVAMSKYDWLKKEPFALEPGVEKQLRRYREEQRPVFGRKIAAGVLMCIVSVIPVIVVGEVLDGGKLESVAVVLLLLLVGCGVNVFITEGVPYGCLGVLLQEGDYTPGRKKRSGLIGRIGAVYWPLVTAAFLAYSFITGDWGRSWIIWPVAGVLYGAIAAICHLTGRNEA